MVKKKRKKGKRKNPGKGPKFEREICGVLSLWWSDGRRNDIFWRTAGSGSRATTRAKRGTRTFGSHGDIGVVDPVGAALLDVFTISLKDGYRDTHASALLDKPGKGRSEIVTWFAEIQESHEQAGSLSWLLIHKRKGRSPVVYLPVEPVLKELRDLIEAGRFGHLYSIRIETEHASVIVVRLDDFLKYVKPETIKHISKHG